MLVRNVVSLYVSNVVVEYFVYVHVWNVVDVCVECVCVECGGGICFRVWKMIVSNVISVCVCKRLGYGCVEFVIVLDEM
jgi:hypothetical protein